EARRQSHCGAGELAERGDIDGLAIDCLALKLFRQHRRRGEPSQHAESDLAAILDAARIRNEGAYQITKPPRGTVSAILDERQQVPVVRSARPAVLRLGAWDWRLTIRRHLESHFGHRFSLTLAQWLRHRQDEANLHELAPDVWFYPWSFRHW